ncbi:hypothetical protein BDW62DRAFT_219468 [Aspergillus aurantiobrunneus]
MSNVRHLCSLCPASFRRQEHLERHSLCRTQADSASDVLQRHWRTCRLRLDAGADIPRMAVAPRPRKRRACDRCARLKKACDLGLPCTTCCGKQHECTYNHSQVVHEAGPQPPPHYLTTPTSQSAQLSELFSYNSVLSETESVGLFHAPSQTAIPPVDRDLALGFAHSAATQLDQVLSLHLTEPFDTFSFGEFQFLDRFTSVTGFVRSFECMREYDVRELARVVTQETSPDELDVLDIGDQSTSLSSHLIEYAKPAFATDIATEACPGCASWVSDPLAAVTNGLVCRLKDVTMHPGPGSPITVTWSPFIEKVCVQLFSPPNIRRYLEYFWAFWYPNCPIIHKPTFNVHNVPYTLLLSMLLIGGSFTPDEAVNRNAKLWLDSAEELIFADEHFRRAIGNGDGIEGCCLRRGAVKALQAAYLICLLQNWEGNDDSKRRIRRARFSIVTAIARELGFSPGSYHERTIEQRKDWEGFIAREEFNRTLAYIFLLDTAFVIFNNTPPKVSISELNIDTVCPERCFQAPTAEDCFLHLLERNMASSISDLPISRLVSRICQGQLDHVAGDYLAALGKLNLFIVVSAFHTLLFHARNTFAPQAAILPIKQGLNNWKQAWNTQEKLSQDAIPPGSVASPRDYWKRTGFMEYAPEYWALAEAIIMSVQQEQTVNQAQSSSSVGMILSRFDVNDMTQLNRFIKWVSSVGMVQV